MEISDNAKQICFFGGCPLNASFRCSQCKSSFYCSKEHQQLHWKHHKHDCIKQKTGSGIKPLALENGHSQADGNYSPIEGKRECRCMFCGQSLLLASEDEAVSHMRDCPGLQHQLSGSEQFTLPPELSKVLSVQKNLS